MPLKNEYLANGVIVWHWGVVTGEELHRSNEAIYEHDYPDKFLFQLLELSRVTEFQVSSQNIRSLAEMDKKETVQCPQIGVIVADKDLIYGMGRMWNMLAESDTFQTNVVRTLDEAIELLRENGIRVDKPVFPNVGLRT